MSGSRIRRVEAWDLRFPLASGAGSDARHTDPVYSLAVCVVETTDGVRGTGITLTLGAGNDLVARAIREYADMIIGIDVEQTVGRLGSWWSELADEPQLRWLGPHKGVTHLALASVCGAVVDAWSLGRRQPLWRLLLDATPDELLAMVDLRALGDDLDETVVRALVHDATPAGIAALQRDGYPGYDTSIGWLGYSKEILIENALAAVDAGAGAVKVKIGSPLLGDDIARVAAVRNAVGPDRLVMVDANQCYDVTGAIEAGRALDGLDVFWFEEPVHPDDLFGYKWVGEAVPQRIAGGEHLPNQISFLSFLRAGALGVAQPDVVRLGGLPEFLAVAMLCARRGVPVAPHVGEMGQLHQHLIPFIALRLGGERIPLECIPHLRSWFDEPARIEGGAYRLPATPGSSTALTTEAFARGTLIGSVEQAP
jgi:L-fuconate dehydratase